MRRRDEGRNLGAWKVRRRKAPTQCVYFRGGTYNPCGKKLGRITFPGCHGTCVTFQYFRSAHGCLRGLLACPGALCTLDRDAKFTAQFQATGCSKNQAHTSYLARFSILTLRDRTSPLAMVCG
jgi:hypothetical protein